MVSELLQWLSAEAKSWQRWTWAGLGTFTAALTMLAARVDVHVAAAPQVRVVLVAALVSAVFIGIVTAGLSLVNFIVCSRLYRRALRRGVHGKNIVWAG